MSRKLLIAASAAALSVLAGALPARADRSCAFVCGPGVPCSTRCTYAGLFITCLNYGPCGPSVPAASRADKAAFLRSLAAEAPAPAPARSAPARRAR